MHSKRIYETCMQMATILEYLLNNWPSVAIFIIIAVGGWIGSRKFTKWEDKHDRKHDELEKGVVNIEGKQQKYEQNIEKILRRIDTLERFLIKNGGADYNEFTQMNSPRQLNPKGRRLYKESGAESFFLEKKEALLRMLTSEMDKIKVKTALDAEMLAIRICYDVSVNEDFKPIKDFIYTHPLFEGTSISVDTIALLMGLELRNLYLSLHPEIDPMN